MSARTRKDWILWGALGCALVSTAHAEYTLATAAHFNEYVALAVPGALDLYVIRALQQRRDVLVAVLAMAAANITSHLIAGGVLRVHWPVIAAVGAVAPLIVWRIYALKYGAGAVSAPAPVEEVPDQEPVALQWAPGHPWGPSADPSTAPDHVPASWMEDEYPETHPSTGHSSGLPDLPAGHSWYKDQSPIPYLAPVPDLPPEYATSAVHSVTSTPVLVATDWPFLPGAQKYVDEYPDPSVKGLRRELRIGQPRAERLLTHLGVRP